MSSGSVEQKEGLLSHVAWLDCLLDFSEEGLELDLVRGFPQCEYGPLQAGADRAEDCDAEPLVVPGVVHWLLSADPGLALEEPGVECSFVLVNDRLAITDEVGDDAGEDEAFAS